MWTEDSSDVSIVAVAHLRLVIRDFSFMRVTEVDPVNYATVIGAAGGAWRKYSLFRNTTQADPMYAPQQAQRGYSFACGYGVSPQDRVLCVCVFRLI